MDSRRSDCVRLVQGGLIRLSKKAASKSDVKQEDLRMERTNQLYGMRRALLFSRLYSSTSSVPSYLHTPCKSILSQSKLHPLKLLLS